MQEPNRIRYYITKNGEEPTVRSVHVAQSAPHADADKETVPNLHSETATPKTTQRRPVAGVKRIVEDAFRWRGGES